MEIPVYWCRLTCVGLLQQVATLPEPLRKSSWYNEYTCTIPSCFDIWTALRIYMHTRTYTLMEKWYFLSKGVSLHNILDALMPFSSASRNNQSRFNDVLRWNLAIDNLSFFLKQIGLFQIKKTKRVTCLYKCIQTLHARLSNLPLIPIHALFAWRGIKYCCKSNYMTTQRQCGNKKAEHTWIKY